MKVDLPDAQIANNLLLSMGMAYASEKGAKVVRGPSPYPLPIIGVDALGCLVDAAKGTVYVVVAAIVRPDDSDLGQGANRLRISTVREALETLKPEARPEMWVMVPESYAEAAAALYGEHEPRWAIYPD